MRLWLTEDLARNIIQQAQDGLPDEVCGLIAGKGEYASVMIPIPNVANLPGHYFKFDERAFATAIFALDAQELSLLGIYHSHPNGDPIPSPTDVREAYYPDTAYLIVSLKNADPRLAAWNIRYQQVTPINLYVGDCEPETLPATESLSQTQKIAIIVSAVLAFAFMIIVSLALLPPAPIIVTPVP